MRINIYQFERSLAIFLLFIPLILIVATGEIRPSISNYAYSSQSNLFVALLSIASTMFWYNYASNNKHWYNIIIGLSLFCVALTPHLDYPILHYISAGNFFFISVLSIGLSSSIFLRKLKWYVALISIIGLALVPFKIYSLFIGEWIAMMPISFHFFVKSLKK